MHLVLKWFVFCFQINQFFLFSNKPILIVLECQVGRQLGLERATLETDSGTLGAIRFYTRTGWTEVTELRYASWKLSIMGPFANFCASPGVSVCLVSLSLDSWN